MGVSEYNNNISDFDAKILSNPERAIQIVHIAFMEVKLREDLKLEGDDHCYKKQNVTLPARNKYLLQCSSNDF